jgi:glycosyltransferase involved in cell wall biosynthesis
VSRLRVAVVADFLEEGWPSMDLVADMLIDRLRAEHGDAIEATLVRPPLRRRASRLSRTGRAAALAMADRVANRFWDYPRAVAALRAAHDVFHVVDHSYAHLVHRLPAPRTLVTCHDLDTFRSLLEPAGEPRSAAFRLMTRHILDGVRKAGHVACDTGATRAALVERAGMPADRTSVVHNGPHPSCAPAAEPAADREAGRLLGPREQAVDILHVGSTVPRKRIDRLLRVVAAVRQARPEVRLVRVGGPLTAEQRALARELGLSSAIVALPFLDRATLAAVYRRAALLVLPSDREGFGLPVLESLACGTPVVASDIGALREVGGEAATYCALEDVEAWRAAIAALLDERRARPEAWRARRRAGLARATAFSWSRYTAQTAALYRRLAAPAPAAVEAT